MFKGRNCRNAGSLGVLGPWCSVLTERIQTNYDQEFEQDPWNARNQSLEVSLPSRRENIEEYHFDETREGEFQAKFLQVREALALLATVAHVDYDDWKYLLKIHCHMYFGCRGEEKFELKIPVQFDLNMDMKAIENGQDETFDSDVAQLCGVRQHDNHSREYLEALAMIVNLSSDLGNKLEGDVIIPVRVYFGAEDVDDAVKPLVDIWVAEKKIREQRQQESQLQSGNRVPPRCTYQLEPMIGDFAYSVLTAKLVETLTCLASNKLSFSRLMLTPLMGDEIVGDDLSQRVLLGQFVTSVFTGIRACTPVTNALSLMGLDLETPPIQAEMIDWRFDRLVQPRDIGAMFSAMVQNQAVSKQYMHLDMLPDDPTNSRHWWKWLAYALFSKRARANSSLESLVLTWVRSMTISDLEAFADVLASDHPEEELFNCPRGRVAERDATLISGSPIRWQFDDHGN